MPDWIKAILYITSTIVLLRIGGKKTISQMTPSEVVIIIGIGTVLVHPLKTKNPWLGIYHAGLIILLTILISLLQQQSSKLRSWIMGEPLLIINDGKIIKDNLKKAKISEDEIKMELRMNQINDISKIKKASLEVSGHIGFELKNTYEYATKEDVEEIKQALKVIAAKLDTSATFYTPKQDPEKNLFTQIEKVQNKDPLQ